MSGKRCACLDVPCLHDVAEQNARAQRRGDRGFVARHHAYVPTPPQPWWATSDRTVIIAMILNIVLMIVGLMSGIFPYSIQTLVVMMFFFGIGVVYPFFAYRTKRRLREKRARRCVLCDRPLDGVGTYECIEECAVTEGRYR